MTTSGSIRESIVRLGEVGSPAILTLDLLMTLLVVLLRIEKVMPWTTFLLMPANRHVSSVESLGKTISSELK